eukprot:gene27609-36335_t
MVHMRGVQHNPKHFEISVCKSAIRRLKWSDSEPSPARAPATPSRLQLLRYRRCCLVDDNQRSKQKAALGNKAAATGHGYGQKKKDGGLQTKELESLSGHASSILTALNTHTTPHPL